MRKAQFLTSVRVPHESKVSQEGDVHSNTDTQALAARQPQNESKEVLVIRRTSSLNQV